MSVNCMNKTNEETYVADVLNKNFYMERRTVAAEGHTAPNMYDFKDINEALKWAKLVGQEECSIQGVELVLSDGVHILKEDPMLSSGLTIPGLLEGREPILYLRDMNLRITGSGTHGTILKIENDVTSGIVFDNMNISLEQFSFQITSHLKSEFQTIYFFGGQGHTGGVGFSDVGIHALYGAVVKFSGRGGSAGMCSSFTDDDEFIIATMGAFIHVIGVDFSEKKSKIIAKENSYIYMYHNPNDENLIYNIRKNKLSHDMSLIYDHEAVGVYTTNLKYIPREDHAEIHNSAGDGVKIPVVNEKEFGFMTPAQKKKLDNLRPFHEDQCPFKFQIWNTEAERDEQTVFVIEGFSVDYMKVFSDGLLVRNNEYSVVKSYDRMELTFNTPRQLGAWIAVEYIL